MGENSESIAGTTENGTISIDALSSMTSDLVAMPVLDQSGEVFAGPGSSKEAQILGIGLKKLRSRDKEEVEASMRYALDLSIKQTMQKQHQAYLQNQQKQAMYSQALQLMGRVYIGSISFEVREYDLKKSFENFGPVKTINMSYDSSTGNHKGFAFLEFEVPEAAVIAQDAMNGLMMGGRNLKVGRPANMPQAQPIIDMIMTEATKYHRVYVASVHPDLSETDLRSVFEAFGVVTKCQLARNNAAGKGAHRGFGYIEFNTRQAATEAISGMNMFDLGGQFLRVGKCITPPEALNYLMPQTQSALPSAAAMAAASITAKIQATEVVQKPSQQRSGGSPGQQSPNPKFSSSAPAHQAIGMDSVNGLFVTAPPPPGPSPCLSLTQSGTSGSNSPMDVSSSPKRNAAGDMLALTQPPPPPPPKSVGNSGMAPRPPPPMGYGGMAPPPPPSMGYGGMGMAPPPVPPPAQMYPPSSFAPPPPPVQIPLESTSSSGGRRTGFGGFANAPPPGILVPPGTAQPGIVDPTAVTEPPKPPKRPKKEKRSDMSILERIKVHSLNPTEKATFAAYEDPLAEIEAAKKEGEQLAILGSKEGDIQAMALALIDGNNAVVLAEKRKAERAKQDEQALSRPKRKKIRPPKAKGPQLTSAAALAAVEKAGALKDALVNSAAGGEDATLASQEGLAIRGNDARHLLMTKLMRTNRSCVLLLKNMVTPDDIDEFLEDEIKEECGKYGSVDDVVIASDPTAGSAKVFVKFSDSAMADSAKMGLDKRFFAGRTIQASIYDQLMFDHGDLTG